MKPLLVPPKGQKPLPVHGPWGQPRKAAAQGPVTPQRPLSQPALTTIRGDPCARSASTGWGPGGGTRSPAAPAPQGRAGLSRWVPRAEQDCPGGSPGVPQRGPWSRGAWWGASLQDALMGDRVPKTPRASCQPQRADIHTSGGAGGSGQLPAPPPPPRSRPAPAPPPAPVPVAVGRARAGARRRGDPINRGGNGRAGLGWTGCGGLGAMEIWSSPAAYDELNGNAERGGGGGDPITRELEEGGGGGRGRDPARLCPGSAAAAGPGSLRGRGGGGGRGLSPGRVPSPSPSVRVPLPAAGRAAPAPARRAPSLVPWGPPRLTLTPGRGLPAPVVVGSRQRDGAPPPTPALPAGTGVCPPVGCGSPHRAGSGRWGGGGCLRVCQRCSPQCLPGPAIAQTVAMLML